jgi:hypothetical protein
MYYIDQTGQIGDIGHRVSARDIRRVHPQLSFGATSDLSIHGYPTLEEVEKPDQTATHYYIPGPDEEYQPGQWRQTWVQQPIPPAPIPTQVTRLQARLALIEAGLWDAVTSYFNDPSRTAEELAFWEDAQVWERENPIIAAAGTTLGLTDAQIDALFTDAATR